MNIESKNFFWMAVIFGIFAIIICSAALWTFSTTADSFGTVVSANSRVPIITINNTSIQIKTATTISARERGLSGTKSLENGNGLLFIFEKEEYWGIWMKNMNYPIDIIWINKDKKIVDSKQNATPESYPEVFKPREKSLYVLEVPAGTVRQNNFKIGDIVSF